MKRISRRLFVKRAAGVAGAGLILPSFLARAARTDLAIGFQTWVVREPLNKDFSGTLAKMASYGYETLEMCSPAGYAKYGFGPLSKMDTGELKQRIADSGLTCESSHFTPNELRENLDASIASAHAMGLSQMVVSSPGLPADATLDNWKHAAEEINQWGEAITGSDLIFAYHNHNFEFKKLEDQLIYDVLLEGLDPEVVKLQFQVWVVSIGYQAADYFRAHPGRFISAHLSDWSGSGEEQVPVGSGTVDWADFFEAGTVGGLQNIYVEMGPDVLEESAAYLQGMRAE